MQTVSFLYVFTICEESMLKVFNDVIANEASSRNYSRNKHTLLLLFNSVTF